MKALIRNQGETVNENDGIVGIDWSTGAPLTNEAWAGGKYTLVNDYVPEDPVSGFVPVDPAPVTAPTQDPAADTIVIDGVTYTRTS